MKKIIVTAIFMEIASATVKKVERYNFTGCTTEG